MAELPRISGQEAIKVFGHFGFQKTRQKGSHVVLRKEGKGCVIPLHKELAIGTLRSALRQADISPEDFVKVYKGL